MLIFKIKNEIYLFEIFFNDPSLIKYFENLKDELGDAVIKSGKVNEFYKVLCLVVKDQNEPNETNLAKLCSCITEEKPSTHLVFKTKLMEPSAKFLLSL